MSTDSPRYEYTIRRKILTFLGAKFHIYNDTGELIGFSRQKAFKLKEDIRVFTDESENAPLISIKARSIIDFSAAYDVVDEKTGTSLGALRRKGFSSILRDSWEVLNQNDEPVGKLAEDSMGMAMVRRIVPMGNLFPQKFSLIDGSGAEIANLRTHFNPFVHKMTVAINADSSIHQMVVLAAGILLVAIEGRQKS